MASFYHPANAALTPYGQSLRLWLVAFTAWLLRIRIRVDHLPFGWMGKPAEELPENLRLDDDRAVDPPMLSPGDLAHVTDESLAAFRAESGRTTTAEAAFIVRETRRKRARAAKKRPAKRAKR